MDIYLFTDNKFMKKRPFSSTTAEIKTTADKAIKNNDVEKLKIISYELSFRKRAKAKQLKKRVDYFLDKNNSSEAKGFASEVLRKIFKD